jgi:hypothetical protein
MVIGIISVDSFNIIGFEQPSGKKLFIISILSRMSFTASSRSIPQLNSTLTIAVFSFEVDVSFFKSLTVLNALSNGLTTLFSTSSALAPGYVTKTIAVFISISGIWSIESLLNEKRPKTIIAINISDVVIGFFTDDSYNFMFTLL